MPNTAELKKYYETLTDQQLLNLRAEGGFTEEAELVLRNELAVRHLGSHDVKNFVSVTERQQLREEVEERGGGYRWPGLQLFGKNFLNKSDKEANIQVRTKWFTMSGIPLIPLASYRFHATKKDDGSSPSRAQQSVINRVPIYWPQVLMTYVKTAALIIGTILLGIAVAALWDAFKH